MARTSFADKFGLTLGQCVDNVLAVYARSTEEDRVAGANWYSAARMFSRELGEQVIPQASEREQIIAGASIVAIYSPRCTWGRNMALSLAHVKGETVRAFGASIRKANLAMELARKGGNPLDAVSGRKVSAFARAIAGIHSEPCIDIWALGVALGRRVQNSDYDRMVKNAEGYDTIASAYVAAAATLDIDPHVLQAITWVTFRRESGGSWADNVE